MNARAEQVAEYSPPESSAGVAGAGMIFFYLLVSIMPLARHPLWSQFVGDFTLTKIVGVACCCYALFQMAMQKSRLVALRSRVAALFVLLCAIAVFSHLTKGLPRPMEFNPLFTYASFFFLLVITAALVDSVSRLRWTLLVAIGSIGLASLYVLREWQKYHSIYAGYRPGWVVGDANYFALSALLCLPAAFYLMGGARSIWERLYCFGCIGVTLGAVTLSASRGGFLGLTFSCLWIVWRSKHRMRNLVLAGVVAVPIAFLAPVSPVHRLLHPNYSDVSAEDSRLELWRAGLRMIADHPLTGIGLGNFKPMVSQYEAPGQNLEKIAHNTYIQIAAEMGVPCLLVFLGVWWSAIRDLESARRLVRSAEGEEQLLARAAMGIQAGLLGCMVAMFFLSAETQKLLWLMVFLGPAARALAEDHSSKRAARENMPGEEEPWPQESVVTEWADIRYE